MTRRIPALVITVVAIAALVVAARSTPAAVTPVFSAPAPAWMPAVPVSSGLTDSWFCPGVPATGEDGVGGQVLIGNHHAEPLTAHVSWLGAPGDAVTETVSVDPYSRLVLDVGDRLQAPFVSALVEVEGGPAVVEQRAIHPAGRPTAPCANDTSRTWYLAEGFTVGGSMNNVVITNPFDDAAIVNIGFATEDGSRAPAAYQGLPVDARSVRVIDLGAPGAGAQGEDRLAVQVVASRGRVVVGRSQHFVAGNRLGYTMTLAAPAPRDQWWFADGDKGSGVSEQYSIYNPTDSHIDVDVNFLSIAQDQVPDIEPIRVPARQVVLFDPGPEATVPEGRHATVFSTLSQPSIVVERVLTRTSDGQPYSSVLVGAPPRADAHVASVWHMVAGPEIDATEAIVLYNVDNAPATIVIESFGPGGPEAVPGYEEIEVAPGSRLAIDLSGDGVVDRHVRLTSTTRVFVERSTPNADRSGRTSSWLVPVD